MMQGLLKQYGVGIQLPLIESQGFNWITGTYAVEQSIRAILLTEPGERIGRPDFGVGLRGYLFSPNNITTRALMRDDITRAIETEEHRITLEEVSVSSESSDSTLLTIKIDYSLQENPETLSLIFPFYLDKGVA